MYKSQDDEQIFNVPTWLRYGGTEASRQMRVPPLKRQATFSVAGSLSQDNLRAIECRKCKDIKNVSEFYHSSLNRGFYTCKMCACKHTLAMRDADPAAKLAMKLRLRLKRRGVSTKLTIQDVRRALIEVEPLQCERGSDVIDKLLLCFGCSTHSGCKLSTNGPALFVAMASPAGSSSEFAGEFARDTTTAPTLSSGRI